MCEDLDVQGTCCSQQLQGGVSEVGGGPSGHAAVSVRKKRCDRSVTEKTDCTGYILFKACKGVGDPRGMLR
jgi:hypothetical protein